MASLDSRLSTVEAVVRTLSDAKVTDRLMEMETKQKSHEDANKLALASMVEDISKVEAVAMEAREMVTQTNVLVAQMPDKIIKAIDARNKTKRMELKDWLLALVVIGSFLSPWLIPLVYKAGH